MKHRGALVSCCVTLVIVCQSASESQAQSSGTRQDPKESRVALTKIAASYQVKVDGERIAKLQEPVFRWNKSISDIDDAILFVWTLDDRPVAAGAMLRLTRLGYCHEFQSLAVEPLQAVRAGKAVWEPARSGITFARVPGAPAPADTANKRLQQMTSLGQQFRVEAFKGPPFYPEDSVHPLRFLPKPLLSYRDPKRPELEGALFAFAHDTDPEALLIIENRARGENAGWEFALAPMTSWRLKAWYAEHEVWSIERPPTLADPTHPYFVAGPFPVKEE